MPAYDDLLMLELQSERLGVLWRSQGQAFLDEQAVELQEDVDRLRAAYLVMAESATVSVIRPKRRTRPAGVIDLRQPDVVDVRDPDIEAGWVCSTDGHWMEAAATRCSSCQAVFCRRCILQSDATHGRPLCMECALVAAGVHHKRIRPLAAPGRKK